MSVFFTTDPRPFVPFSVPHLTVLALIPVITFFLCRQARRSPESTVTRAQTWTLAIILLAAYPLKLWEAYVSEWLELPFPMHLCDWAAIVCALALITRRVWLAELAWFWGMAGTLQGLITPELAYAFPHARFIVFFQLHAGVVIAAFYLTLGLGLRPRPGAVWRAFAILQIYTVTAGIVTFLSGHNYGFLRAKPSVGSLLDYLGPWPWYILAMEALALVFFTLLYLPFGIRNRKLRDKSDKSTS